MDIPKINDNLIKFLSSLKSKSFSLKYKIARIKFLSIEFYSEKIEISTHNTEDVKDKKPVIPKKAKYPPPNVLLEEKISFIIRMLYLFKPVIIYFLSKCIQG